MASELMPQAAVYALGALFLAVLLFGVWSGIRLLTRSLFANNPRYLITQVDQILVKTDGILPAPQIREYAGIEEGTNLFEFDLESTRDLLESHAIIKSAKLQRVLPNRLLIDVKERTGIARLGPEAQPHHWVVSDDGWVIRRSFRMHHLPVINGIDPGSFTLGTLMDDPMAKDGLRAIKESQAFREYFTIQSIAVGHSDQISVRLKEGHQLIVPRDRIAVSLRRAAASLKAADDRGMRQPLKIDLRPSRDPIVSPIGPVRRSS